MPVLQDHSSDVVVVNESPIPANFAVFLFKKSSPFRLLNAVGEIAPGQSASIRIVVNLDDTLPVVCLEHVHLDMVDRQMMGR